MDWIERKREHQAKKKSAAKKRTLPVCVCVCVRVCVAADRHSSFAHSLPHNTHALTLAHIHTSARTAPAASPSLLMHSFITNKCDVGCFCSCAQSLRGRCLSNELSFAAGLTCMPACALALLLCLAGAMLGDNKKNLSLHTKLPDTAPVAEQHSA